ncbi:hypothetical protein yberc0001_11390 [Yersinia bercovieri ATCC 43970]|uniref:Transposase n=1 Tax=Yersinia bercovieri ATCC 43970 TaxID=349968 RepID=A0ABM9XXB3_YERBE|nr:hypothetical protein yberc0001_11390 [Yersinia bercovieri ATCC 43970]
MIPIKPGTRFHHQLIPREALSFADFISLVYDDAVKSALYQYLPR